MDLIKKAQNGGVKNMKAEELENLCVSLREYIVENISNTGGHLASNLGSVEAIVAIHKSFNLPYDKVVFDVGHQCYVHKILTERYEKFKNIRQFGGISGFPKTEESEYDIFNSGHSSNSISAALGIKRGLELNGDKSNVIAFIGDGALTGGMAYEAMNDAGRSDSKIIIILNDNEMSISENVGGIAAHLSKLRTSISYIKAKKRVTYLLYKLPYIGKFIYKIVSRCKKLLRNFVSKNKNNIFEDLGFYYAGPYDGHDIKTMTRAFNTAKWIDKPAVIHIVTKKGKGYSFAEKRPEIYHGVKSFDINKGIENIGTQCFSNVFGHELVLLAEENKKITAITAAMPDGTGLGEFKNKFKSRYFDVGIAEGHAVGLAAGLAIGGSIPVFAVYSPFLLRGYDQLLTDVCGMNLHCIFCVDRSGITGEDGETHQGVFDTAYLKPIPNLTIFSPATYSDLKRMLKSAVYDYNSPCAIKYPRGTENSLVKEYEEKCGTDFSDKKAVILKEGTDISIYCDGISAGDALSASLLLEKDGVSAEVVNLRFLKPLDENTIIESYKKTKKAVCVESGVLIGGICADISAVIKSDILSIGVGDYFIPHGSVEQLKYMLKIDGKSIYEKIKKEFFSENEA